MKKRILFVDDETLVLDGLSRMLRHMRNEWDMVFVSSGSKALQLMDESPYDVIVSDMRMPQMNGAQLLNEVLKRHPATIRLILSGFSDQDLIMKCVGSTHQYLSKPCEPELLLSTILRATALDSILKNESLRAFTLKIGHLPSQPSLYLEIIKILQTPGTSLKEVAAVIAKDIGMTSKILNLVNSAFFGIHQSVSNLEEATISLGLDTITSLVLSLHIFSQYENKYLGPVSLDDLWKHSLETGIAARRISMLQNVDQRMVDDSYIAGMLHDAGKLILASNYSQEYLEIVSLAKQKKTPLYIAEREVFGATHSEIGGYLFGLWGLPISVVEAITLHEQPGQIVEFKFSPLTAVHAANALLKDDVLSTTGRNTLDRDYLKKLNLENRIPEWQKAIEGILT